MWNNKMTKAIMAWILVFSMVFPMLPTGTVQAADATAKDYNSMTMEQILDSNESLTWVFAGDSITHNGSWSQGMNSYSEWFEQYLYDINRGDDSVVLTAWGGADIYDFQYKENTPGNNGATNNAGMGLENMITKYNPDVVFIKLGMNDRGKTTEEFEKYYNMMLDGIYTEGAKKDKIPKIVILTPTPLSGENLYDDSVNPNPSYRIQDNTLRHRNALEKIASERGLLFCDLRTAFLEEQIRLGEDYRRTIFSDPSDGGIHPNAAGQYLIFKTLSKTLGIFDETKELYQLEYADLDSAALYVDGTSGVTYTGGYDVPSVDVVDDAVEMNKAMPTLSGVSAMASVEFDAQSGNVATLNTTGIDIDTDTETINALTLNEVKTLGREFTVVFRARLDAPNNNNAPILSFASNDLDTNNWDNAFTLGVQGKADQCYYQMRADGNSKVGGSNTFTLGKATTAGDGIWHTIAVVQRAGSFDYYVDGTLAGSNTSKILNASIGETFASATAFSAKIGYYGANAKTYDINGKFDYWQFYGHALSAEQVETLSSDINKNERTVTWKETVPETNVWAVVGAEQMSGYEGPVVNRSLFRLLDNVMRGGGNNVASMRDVRLINLAKPGNTVAAMYENYDATIGEHAHNVLLVLPEVSQVYAEGYTHSETLVAEYKSAIKNLIAKEDGMVVLWTPLASNNPTMNGYITDYANAVRKIAVENTNVLFYDANKFMTDNMAKNEVLTRNWFEEDMYISPLCAVDLVTSFYQTTALSGTGIGEVTDHTLRLTSDKRTFKGEYVRDYIASDVAVDGTKVTIDVSAIMAAYPELTNVRLTVLSIVGAGNFNENILNLADVTTVATSGNTYTFEAPCSNPVITVYGELNGYTYRFKDVEVDVTTSATIDVTPNPDGVYLDSLEVVGAPALEFDADTTSYNVTLYQYQRNVQILAKAQDGLTITVNDKVVESGENSHLIAVDTTATVTVKVSGRAGTKTYMLNLTRQEYPDIIITEVMQDGYGNYHQAGGDNYELIEIYNASGRELNLKDYSIAYKKDYRYSGLGIAVDSPNYYFTGNNLAFQSTSGSSVTYTGINQITKYSSYWSNDVVNEPETIPFPADSTMVIWVKFSPGGAADKTAYGENLTYDTLIQALEENKDTYTLSVNGEAVVPTLDQLVVAEVPKGITASGVTATSNKLAKNSPNNFYMDNHGAENAGSGTRSWLFILGADAEKAENGAITKAGNDIISALKQARLNSTNKLSSVFSYNFERGMSLVKDEGHYDALTVGEGHTSDEQGYSNLTSFGAIEYWQKPYNFADKKAPVVLNATPSEMNEGKEAEIRLTMSDETDLRYVELYVMKDGDLEWTKVTQDYVLESCVENQGVAKRVTGTRTFTYGLGEVTDTIQYYAVVSDGNNVVEIGTETNPMEINASEGRWSKDNNGNKYTNPDGTTPNAGWAEIDGESYYFNQSGYAVTGWVKDSNEWYYMDDETGAMLTNDWVDNTYYLQEDGTMATGWAKLGGTYYYFDGAGVKVKNQWIGDYYLKSDGSMAVNEVADGYYVDSTGKYVSRAGWYQAGEKWYYLQAGGLVYKGWLLEGGTWYYLSSDGVMTTGWKKIDNVWYYFHSSGAMATGWLLDGATWYYLQGSGAMATGWLNLGGTWYYLQGSGAMATSWLNLGGTWYYLHGSGAMAANEWVGNYYLLGSGAMATNQWIGRYYVDKTGLWTKTR